MPEAHTQTFYDSCHLGAHDLISVRDLHVNNMTMPSVLKWKKHKAVSGIYKRKHLTLTKKINRKDDICAAPSPMSSLSWKQHGKGTEAKKGRKKKVL